MRDFLSATACLLACPFAAAPHVRVYGSAEVARKTRAKHTSCRCIRFRVESTERPTIAPVQSSGTDRWNKNRRSFRSHKHVHPHKPCVRYKFVQPSGGGAHRIAGLTTHVAGVRSDLLLSCWCYCGIVFRREESCKGSIERAQTGIWNPDLCYRGAAARP